MITEWIALGLGAVACAAVVGWLKAYREARDWERCCVTLGEQYDQYINECEQEPEHVQWAALGSQAQRGGKWLN